MKMGIKMLIVDDEPVIGKGLKLTIPWSESNVEVVGIAYDGMEALDFIQQKDVDIVLTDVKMPYMNGLELIEKAQLERQDIKFVVMSGYEEFDFARKAVKLGVKDYLLKPIKIDELMNVIHDLVQQIQSKRSKAKQSEKETRQKWLLHYLTETQMINMNHMQKMQRFFQDGPFGFNIIISELENYGIIQEVNNRAKLTRMKKKWIDTINAQAMQKEWGITSVFIHTNILASLVFSKEYRIESTDLNTFTSSINESIELSNRLIFGYSSSFNTPESLTIAFGEAKNHLYLSEQRFGDVKSKLMNNTINMKLSTEGQIVNALIQQDKEKLYHLIQNLFANFKTRKLMLNEVINELHDVLLMIERNLYPIKFDNIGVFIFSSNVIDIHIHNTYDSLEHLFMKDIMELLKLIKTSDVNNNHWIIERVKTLINEKYRENIKAAEIADLMNITPNYFSLIFKEKVNMNFNEYLNEVRIKHAKVLLKETTDKVSKIAKKVGYTEYKYFAKVFKDMNGITPTEFRNLFK